MSEESLSMIDLELANVSLSEGISELQQQLAQREHDCQDMETKLHNECQAHERTKQQLAESDRKRRMADDKCIELATVVTELRQQLAEAQGENKVIEGESGEYFSRLEVLKDECKFLNDKLPEVQAELADITKAYDRIEELYIAEVESLQIAERQLAEAHKHIDQLLVNMRYAPTSTARCDEINAEADRVYNEAVEYMRGDSK